MRPSRPPWQIAHDNAVTLGEKTYIDSETGYHVFTETALLDRGECCGAGCRHCPFDHTAVSMDKRTAHIQKPALLMGEIERGKKHRVFSWSGGKDSFLALARLARDEEDFFSLDTVLLTTFDSRSRRVAHQEIAIDLVKEQAERLQVPLLGVPVHPEQEYQTSLRAGLATLQRAGAEIVEMNFGDLHLQHVLEWRTAHLEPLLHQLGARLRYPIFHCPYQDLLTLWEESKAQARISASLVKSVQKGQAFNREFFLELPPEVDGFGENGEFHTLLQPHDSI
ncbi:MAG: DUF5522 domain-containing protein, partial [Polyangiaceae bacterium]|nr:DUF5522 domain-containing protein [Polyangiaceae bacterium]